MDLDGSFGRWLKQRRKALDLTQQDLADQIGCAVITVRKIEARDYRPSKQIAERLADALAVSQDERAAFVYFARRMADTQPALSVDLTSLLPFSNMPVQLTPFVGRENELAQIAERLIDPTCRMLTLVGTGGIGKTRLALQAVTNKVEAFGDGVFFVSLTPVGSITLIAPAIASALQISFYGQEDPNIWLVNYLSSKHMRLVIDNCEHLLEGIGLLSNMLANAPRLKILATSRERLNIQEEWVLPVEGFAFPFQETSNELGSYSAVQLFVQSARRVQPNFSLDGNHVAVIEICQAVEGMPLGIELAATWLRAVPCQQIAGQIRRNVDFLATPLRNMPERHRSLRAVFEHSWGLLGVDERGILMKFSVFRGGIDPAAAQHVAGASLLMLASLVDKSLLRLNSAGRYELHELLRQFAADKLTNANETAAAQRCHLEYFLELAEQLEWRLTGPQQVVTLDRLEIEFDNFRVALDWVSRVGDAAVGLRMAGALGWFWYLRDYWNEGREWLDKFLATDSTATVPVQAKALHLILELSVALQDEKTIAALSAKALRLAREVDDKWYAAWLLSSLGLSLKWVSGSQSEARQAYF